MSGVIWITGLAGAGKTSLANQVIHQLRDGGVPCLQLDGDVLRGVIGETRHDRESRLCMAYRISRLAALVAEQGFIAVVSTISLFHEVHAQNRSASIRYLEVLVECPMDNLRKRHEIYDGADVSNVVGLGIAAEFPTHPDLVIDNGGDAALIELHARSIVAAWSACV